MSVLAWSFTDDGGLVRHRPATDEVLDLYRRAYLGTLDLPLLCPLPALQEQTDALGIPGLSVMAGLTQLVNRGDLEVLRFSHAEVVNFLRFKKCQQVTLPGVKTCAWCQGTTPVLVRLEHAAGTDQVCGSCAEEYAYFVTQDFYQPTPRAIAQFLGREANNG